MRTDGMVKDARSLVREVAPATVECTINEFIVIDVREPHEVLQGYLPNAINVPRGTIEFRVTDDVRFGDRRQAILVYSGVGERSVLAALTLSQLGYSDVQSLAGGIERWSEENRTIE